MTTERYIALLPAVLSALTALGLVLLGLRSRDRKAGALAAAFGAAMAANLFRHVLGRVMGDAARLATWDRTLLAVFQLSLPVGVHLIYTLAELRRGRWIFHALYVLTVLAMPVTALTGGMVTGFRATSVGLVPLPGPGMYAFAALSLLAGAAFLPLLLRRGGHPAMERIHRRAFVYGLLGCVLLCFGDLLAGVGLLGFPTSILSFLPLALLTWSLLHSDLSATSREVIRRGAANDVAFGVLILIVAGVVTLAVSLLPGEEWAEVLTRFFPYALPASLSTLVCLTISFAAFAKGDTNLGTLLFGIFTGLWALYTADLALVAVVSDPEVALWVSRVDHLGLVLNLAVTFHLCVAVSGASVPRWLVPVGYGVATLTLPLVLTDLYIPRMHRYWFGYFAMAGPAMQAYLAVGIPFVCYGLLLLHRASRGHPSEQRRNLARYMLWGCIGALALLLGAIPGTLGIPLYPPAQFLFVPFVLMASGLLMSRAVSFRTFLRVGVARVLAMLVLSLVFALAIVAVADATAGQRRFATVAVIALVMAVAFIPAVRHVYDWIGRLAEAPEERQAVSRQRALCRRLEREADREESARRVAKELAELLETDASIVLVGEGDTARLTGVRLLGGAATPVHLWPDDPLLRSLLARASENPGPEVPAVRAGALYDLLPSLALVAPVTYQGEPVAVLGVGVRKDGLPHPQEAWEHLEALAERIAPYLRIQLYYRQEGKDALCDVTLPQPDTGPRSRDRGGDPPPE